MQPKAFVIGYLRRQVSCATGCLPVALECASKLAYSRTRGHNLSVLQNGSPRLPANFFRNRWSAELLGR